MITTVMAQETLERIERIAVTLRELEREASAGLDAVTGHSPEFEAAFRMLQRELRTVGDDADALAAHPRLVPQAHPAS